MTEGVEIALIGILSVATSVILSWILGRIGKALDAKAAKKGKLSPEYLQLKEEIELIRAELEANKLSDQVILEDRIKFIGRSYIKQGFIFAEDKDMLLRMWDVYHNKRGGNGYLTSVMDAVNALEVRFK